MSLIIENEKAAEMLRKVAARRGISTEEALEQLCAQELQETAADSSALTPDQQRMKERILAIARRSSPYLKGHSSDHASLYGEDGLPQ